MQLENQKYHSSFSHFNNLQIALQNFYSINEHQQSFKKV
jgi:hypothetical protein